jgi:hypothetical protein
VPFAFIQLGEPKFGSFTLSRISMMLPGEISVHDAVTMRMVERVGDLDCGAQRERQRQRTVRPQLDGDGPIESRVARAVDLTHSTGAERCEDFERAETVSRGEPHDGVDFEYSVRKTAIRRFAECGTRNERYA